MVLRGWRRGPRRIHLEGIDYFAGDLAAHGGAAFVEFAEGIEQLGGAVFFRM
jgi:hypothetical protein